MYTNCTGCEAPSVFLIIFVAIRVVVSVQVLMRMIVHNVTMESF